MAGAIGIPDTKLGRETICNSFAWAMSQLEKLPPGVRYTMTLERDGGLFTFRYYPEQKT